MIGNWNWDWPGAFGMGFGWLFMILFWGLVLLGIVALVRRLIKPEPGASGSGASAVLGILEQRYARGEIGRDEFEQKKRDLLA